MISKDKTYCTRDGREVRIYATDGHPDEPVHGAFKDYSGRWNSSMWKLDGSSFYGKDAADLIEVKPRIKRTVWLSVYPSAVWFSIENGEFGADCLARVRVDIDCEEGEGL
jgi:hypothetical protein